MNALAEQIEASEHDSSGKPASALSQSIWTLAFAKLLSRGASRPLFAIAAGFAAGALFALAEPALALIAAVGTLIGITIFWLKSSPPLTLLALSLIGFGVAAVRTAEVVAPHSDDIARMVGVPALCMVSGVIAGDPVIRPHSISAYLDVSSINIRDQATASSGRISVWLTGQAALKARALEPGDMVSLDGILDNAPPQYGSAVPIDARVEGACDRMRSLSTPASRALGLNAFHFVCNRCLAILATSMNPADAATTGAILLGDKTGLGPSLKDAFVDTGTVHLLATAGLHVGIVVLILRFVLSRLTVPPKWIAAISILMVWLYASMAGGRPAVTRAAFVATVYLLAVILERIPDLLSALSLCAIVLLWIEPRLLLDAGFQLTFMTVLGIIGLMPALMALFEQSLKKIKWTKRRLWAKRFVEVECLSVSAQASSAPMVAEQFNLVTIYGLGANLLSVPIMFFFIPTTILTIACGAVSEDAGSFMGHFVTAPLLRSMTFIISATASIPHCAVSISSPSWLLIAVYYFVLFGGSFVIQTLAKHQADHHPARDPAPADTGGLRVDDPLAAAK